MNRSPHSSQNACRLVSVYQGDWFCYTDRNAIARNIFLLEAPVSGSMKSNSVCKGYHKWNRRLTDLAVFTMVCQAQDFEGVLVADVGVEIASKHVSISLVEVYPSSCKFYHLR